MILSTDDDLSSLLWHLPMDEVVIESLPRTTCLGCASSTLPALTSLESVIEHTPPHEVALTSLETVQHLKDKVSRGACQVASEAR